MPKRKPDRDDGRGGLGEGGPQDGPIGGGGAERQSGDDAGGEGGQRHEGGSSRDSENQS